MNIKEKLQIHQIDPQFQKQGIQWTLMFHTLHVHIDLPLITHFLCNVISGLALCCLNRVVHSHVYVYY